MDERLRRIGHNEALFREVNERIESLNESFAAITERMSIVCECASIGCMELLSITVEDYRQLRSDSTTFAVAPGHVIPDVESVIETREGYEVIRKHAGEAAELAIELDR
jgi:hypothetical protein